MHCIDVFNGDADGICALQQLRLHQPRPEARLVTGCKRDITLLDRLDEVAGAMITVLDISLDRNRASLEGLLARGNTVFYADHHYSGTPPDSPQLQAHIDCSPLICTSLIIDRHLFGRFRTWALVGAFGDNLDGVACAMAEAHGLDGEKTERLRETGRLLNYNGYGAGPDDLLIHPADLFREVHRHPDPFVLNRDSALLAALRRGYGEDMARAAALSPWRLGKAGRIYRLPPAPWSRRVAGEAANRLAREEPALAHALVVPDPQGGLTISVRAPLTTRSGADDLCRRFPGGGGRAAAAGINRLPEGELESFLAAFDAHFT